jgi:hypothetical protein
VAIDFAVVEKGNFAGSGIGDKKKLHHYRLESVVRFRPSHRPGIDQNFSEGWN